MHVCMGRCVHMHAYTPACMHICRCCSDQSASWQMLPVTLQCGQMSCSRCNIGILQHFEVKKKKVSSFSAYENVNITSSCIISNIFNNNKKSVPSQLLDKVKTSPPAIGHELLIDSVGSSVKKQRIHELIWILGLQICPLLPLLMV